MKNRKYLVIAGAAVVIAIAFWGNRYHKRQKALRGTVNFIAPLPRTSDGKRSMIIAYNPAYAEGVSLISRLEIQASGKIRPVWSQETIPMNRAINPHKAYLLSATQLILFAGKSKVTEKDGKTSSIKTDTLISAHSLKDGHRIWQHEFKDRRRSIGAAIRHYKNLVIAATNHTVSGQLYLTALNLRTGKRIWEHTFGREHGASMHGARFVGNRILIDTNHAALEASADTGSTRKLNDFKFRYALRDKLYGHYYDRTGNNYRLGRIDLKQKSREPRLVAALPPGSRADMSLLHGNRVIYFLNDSKSRRFLRAVPLSGGRPIDRFSPDDFHYEFGLKSMKLGLFTPRYSALGKIAYPYLPIATWRRNEKTRATEARKLKVLHLPKLRVVSETKQLKNNSKDGPHAKIRIFFRRGSTFFILLSHHANKKWKIPPTILLFDAVSGRYVNAFSFYGAVGGGARHYYPWASISFAPWHIRDNVFYFHWSGHYLAFDYKTNRIIASNSKILGVETGFTKLEKYLGPLNPRIK